MNFTFELQRIFSIWRLLDVVLFMYISSQKTIAKYIELGRNNTCGIIIF
ncbi:hypothetical protein TPHV1_220044 [Treponema phagedenis]|uniref:Uncharacterized protein n=1 Tax=Treponema phagedenis TaxID=162 RepID=A0A0B7GY74_TREPH|nr:hypothetical protein TPHV1_220044 [Treponema phagedenis]